MRRHPTQNEQIRKHIDDVIRVEPSLDTDRQRFAAKFINDIQHPYLASVMRAVFGKVRVRFESIDLWRGEHKQPKFLAKNYSGTLPVLQVEDGSYIAECTAITMYLDSLGSKPLLTGVTAQEKGVIHMMSKRAEIEFLDAISVYFHHATPGLGPDVEVYQNREWGLRMRDKALRGARYFNTVLESQPYVAGNTYSMADITVIAAFIFARIVKLEIPDNLTALHDWHNRMLERRTVQGWENLSDPTMTSD